MPTEEGKVRRVLVDPEFIRLADLGGAADIEEAMAIAGATLSQITGGVTKRALSRSARGHP